MKIWRVNNYQSSGGNKKVSSVSNTNTNTSNNNVVVLGGKTTTTTATTTMKQQQQQSTEPVSEVKDPNFNFMPSFNLFQSPEPTQPAVVQNKNEDDARNDTTTENVSPKVIEKKELRKHNIMNIGRSHKASNARKSSSSRDLPEGEVSNTNHGNIIASSPTTRTPSSALSQLLFSKQHMDQREQMKVEYTQFGPSAVDLLTVQADDGMPSPEGADHVVVKVQVSDDRNTNFTVGHFLDGTTL